MFHFNNFKVNSNWLNNNFECVFQTYNKKELKNNLYKLEKNKFKIRTNPR